jgi:hypothetical protein
MVVRKSVASSDVADHARARAELVGLDAHLMKHPHVEVRERAILLAVVEHMPGVLEAAAGDVSVCVAEAGETKPSNAAARDARVEFVAMLHDESV